MQLDELTFSSDWADNFPSDPSSENTPRQVRNALYSDVLPTKVPAPRMIAWSDEVASILGIDRTSGNPRWADILSGNSILKGMRPVATRYGGHQFGQWAGQLGDGRAIILGELRNNNAQSFELQLKGAGPTPYSRFADGRAVLRSSIREFVASEAMHFLGVPTTRALSLVDTGQGVERDMFYNGNAVVERGAIVCRVAPTFLRFGHFQILHANQEVELLGKLIDDTISRYFPQIEASTADERRTKWFAEICKRTAEMIVHWMRVGFVHGVMNTDNMSVLGTTIDYGPFGFLEPFQPDWTPNTTDAAGRRYCYAHQPQIALWNLQALAHSLMTVMKRESLEEGLASYRQTYQKAFEAMMASKLGLRPESYAEVADLVFQVLEKCGPDWTLFFLKMEDLGSTSTNPLSDAATLNEALYEAHSEHVLAEFVKKYRELRLHDAHCGFDAKSIMRATNPVVVPRNYLLHNAITQANNGQFDALQNLLAACKTPYDRRWLSTPYAHKRPTWAADTPGCATLSCSS